MVDLELMLILNFWNGFFSIIRIDKTWPIEQVNIVCCDAQTMRVLHFGFNMIAAVANWVKFGSNETEYIFGMKRKHKTPYTKWKAGKKPRTESVRVPHTYASQFLYDSTLV